MKDWTYRKSCCAECPWRLAAPRRKFTVERFRALAATTYDRAFKVFTCHMSSETVPAICAGFLLRGALHNFTVRLAERAGEIDLSTVKAESGLFANYRAMAIANGVDRRDPCLRSCRDQET